MKARRHRILFAFFLLLVSAGAFLSCGIDEYYYLTPVPSGNIQLRLNEQATIQLPTVRANYFTHFTIFYRIYISGYAAPGTIQTSSTELSRINPTLASDYASIEPSTSITSTVANTSNTGTLFKTRNYQVLDYENSSSGNKESNVLARKSDSVEGETLIIDFPTTGTTPYLTVKNRNYKLIRSTGNGSFSPVPGNRYFLNTPELYSSDNAISTINKDVVNNSVTGPRYTYVSMYIASSGIEEPTYSEIFSIPTFIGIFRLPDN